MILTAVRETETVELGRGFNMASAYEFIAENDRLNDYRWFEGFDLVLTDGADSWVLEADCWSRYVC